MLTTDMAVTEIAQTLLLSVKTVSTYRKRILDKMGMHNNAGMAQYAMSIGLMY